MSWRMEKEANGVEAIVFEGWENGIAASPHKGVANLQNVNIVTESGEVMCSYARIQQSQANNASSHTLLPGTSSTLIVSAFNLNGGVWINVSASSITGLSTGNYYVLNATGATIQVAATYNGAAVTGLGATGTATFTLVRNMTQPIASCTETYGTSSSSPSYRYYVLDSQGLVWVYDTAVVAAGVTWFLPDFSITYFGSSGAPTGINVLNGWLMVFGGNAIWCKPTDNLADTSTTSTNWTIFASGYMNALFGSTTKHFAYVGHQSTLYFTDGNFVGSIFPTSGVPNVFSYAKYTTSTTTGTITSLIGGTAPTTSTGTGAAGGRLQASFFAAPGGTLPTALPTSALYYIEYSRSAGTFQVFAAPTGGSALDITTGATGTQYFNTFNPTTAASRSTYIYSPQALTLPFFEITQSMTEIGNVIVVGCQSNTLYQWDQVAAQPTGFIPLPENNVVNLLTVENMAYVFAGSKGNIYITNGSTASAATSVPDYCSGQIEPYFVWGGAMFLRGRVYFSLQDQNASNTTGNCGGIWSFVPTQNLFIGQDVGLALRVENQNSYSTYNGMATVLLPAQNQAAQGPQYWAAWQSAYTSGTYGIDFSAGNTRSQTTIIETDFVPTGTMLEKRTFKQIEYKLAASLLSGESVTIKYRVDLGASFTAIGTTLNRDSTTSLSGYFPVDFEKGQWLQLQATLTPVNNSVTSFVRLVQLRVR